MAIPTHKMVFVAVALWLLLSTSAQAVLRIEITEGAEGALPIAVVPFDNRTDRPEMPASGRPSGSNVPGSSTRSAESGTGRPMIGFAPGTPCAAISNGSSVRDPSPAV